MRRDYLPDDYAADIAGQSVVASVHAETLWDRNRPAVEETAWLADLPKPVGIAARCVAAAPLIHPDISKQLDAQAAFPMVAGIRKTIRWHPNPAKRWTPQGIVYEPAWRAGVAHLARYGWLLELLMNPHQALEVAELARVMPGQTFVVNHCCTPIAGVLDQCIDSAVRDACDLGYIVTTVTDACATHNQERHDWSLRTIAATLANLARRRSSAKSPGSRHDSC